MPNRWRDDDEWRSRSSRGRGGNEPYGGRRSGEGDYGDRMGEDRDRPRYGYGPDDGRYYGERDGYPRDLGGGVSGSMGSRWDPDDVRARYGAGGDLGRGGYGNAEYPGGYYGGPGNSGYGYGGYGGNARRGEDRNWMDKAGDEVSSWFGDDEAGRRREMDRMRSGHYGRGPRGYKRSDERIAEDVNDRLTDDWRLDATEIEVSVSNGEVTLSGTVQSRDDKRRAEDLAESCSGVSDVQNNIRVNRSTGAGSGTDMGTSGTAAGMRDNGATNRAH